jgi:adenylate cyclase
MAAEIERRFLVADPRRAVGDASGEEIAQGYVAIDEETQVRVRRRGDHHTLTVKRGSGESRFEEEIELDGDQFASLWPLTEGRRVVKCRYLLGDRRRIELDVFAEALEGLAIAEVEFGSTEQADEFEPPGWFGPEVTGQGEYANVNLAVAGRPKEER